MSGAKPSAMSSNRPYLIRAMHERRLGQIRIADAPGDRLCVGDGIAGIQG